jgi:hypothetical protein
MDKERTKYNSGQRAAFEDHHRMGAKTTKRKRRERRTGMVDIDAKVRALVEGGATRKDMIRALKDMDATANHEAKRLARGTKDERARAREERANVDRLGRLLFFLQDGRPADRATEADHLLYDLLQKCPD